MNTNREASAAIVADLNRDLANVKRTIAAQWVDGEFRGDEQEDAYHHAVMGQILRDIERHSTSTAQEHIMENLTAQLDSPKQFQLDGKSEHRHYEASRLGWDSGSRGWAALDSLPVGAATVDDDGCTWRRTA